LGSRPTPPPPLKKTAVDILGRPSARPSIAPLRCFERKHLNNAFASPSGDCAMMTAAWPSIKEGRGGPPPIDTKSIAG